MVATKRISKQISPAGEHVSLRTYAYQTLKKLIITGQYAPGAYLNEAEVAQSLGLGRTPINQAMQRLALENLIVIMPRKGVYVKPLSIDEVQDINEVRTLNEAYAARLAAKNATKRHIDDMRLALRNARDHQKNHDVDGFLNADRAFHEALADAAGNAHLSELLNRLHEQAQRYWFVSLATRDQMKNVMAEHKAVLSAIIDKDAKGAAAAMTTHIGSLGSSLSQHLQNTIR